MRANILDNEALASVTPAALTAYVRAEGWERAERFGRHSDVYVHPDFGELIIPGLGSLGDYPRVIEEIVSRLAMVEHRGEFQVYRDLIGADRDVIRIKTSESDDDGSVSVDSGVEIVTQSRDLLLSAACAAKDPRPTYRAGKIKEASEYMSRVRLGQTEHGSFIVTLLAPVPPALTAPSQAELWPSLVDEPFERLVTRRLADALAVARESAEQAIRGKGWSAFANAIPLGISANLCEAVAALTERGEALEVSLTWARTRPTPEPRRKVEFSRAEGEVLREAARVFRSLEPRPDERLEAFVINLDRKQEQEEGRITLKTFLDGRPVSVRTELSSDLYSKAVEAHDRKYPVVITGDLRRRGQRWWLDDPRNLTIIEDDDAGDDADET
jgi:hypothetical protein